MKKSNISNEALAVLSEGFYLDGVFRINSGQLERALYQEVNKVLENFGGKWNKKSGGHTFDTDPSEKLDDAIATGTYARLDRNGYFRTSDGLADELIGMLQKDRYDRVLEPSCGDGQLIRAFLRAKACSEFMAVEPNRDLMLKAANRTMDLNTTNIFFHYFGGNDFEDFEPSHKFDAIVMNPPFQNSLDVAHILRAIELLKPGGELVAIASVGITFRRGKKYIELENILNNGGAMVTANPDGAFKEAGTNVRTVRLWYQKPESEGADA